MSIYTISPLLASHPSDQHRSHGDKSVTYITRTPDLYNDINDKKPPPIPLVDHRTFPTPPSERVGENEPLDVKNEGAYAGH
jgi:hypothetical protein